jgi:cytochrome c553
LFGTGILCAKKLRLTDLLPVAALGWVLREMEDRYRLLHDKGVRSVDAYNRLIAESAQAAADKADEACAACHGPEGNKPTTPETPRLGGQQYDYLVHALHDYRNGMRDNAVMSAMAKPLTEREIGELAGHVSFEEVTWLLWHGGLPTAADLDTVTVDRGALGSTTRR